jgi:Asp-tRNA(Asn)/Glu-tRNA(Gln) amidotransferase A subunit family amidase
LLLLRRIDAVEPALGAVVARDDDAALVAADAADAAQLWPPGLCSGCQ